MHIQYHTTTELADKIRLKKAQVYHLIMIDYGITGVGSETLTPAVDWLAEHIGKPEKDWFINIGFDSTYVVFWFTNKDHAFKFKLAFC